MNGKAIVIGLIGIALIAGAGLWYSIERAYYRTVSDVIEVVSYENALSVSQYAGIDADTSPLKMRACFKVNWDYVASDTYKTEATPLRAPRFFDCFNAKEITSDLETGNATAVLLDENRPYGFNTYVAQYPDGRAFMWRQINTCGEAEFSGNDLPEGCPDRQTIIIEEIDNTTVIQESKVEPSGQAVPAVVPAALEPIDTIIRLQPYTGLKAEPIAVEDLRVVAAVSDPMTFRGCFKTELSYGLLTETYQTHDTPDPAATALDCFDADSLHNDLATGTAIAFVGEKDIQPGIDRVIAVYDDGRAYVWHQKSRSE